MNRVMVETRPLGTMTNTAQMHPVVLEVDKQMNQLKLDIDHYHNGVKGYPITHCEKSDCTLCGWFQRLHEMQNQLRTVHVLGSPFDMNKDELKEYVVKGIKDGRVSIKFLLNTLHAFLTVSGWYKGYLKRWCELKGLTHDHLKNDGFDKEMQQVQDYHDAMLALYQDHSMLIAIPDSERPEKKS